MPMFSVTYRVKSPLQTIEVEADNTEWAVHAAIEQAALEQGAEIMISQTVEQLTPPEVGPSMTPTAAEPPPPPFLPPPSEPPPPPSEPPQVA
jgi:hypothetical protein